ncbi:MAG: hypothetical protein ACOCV2_12205 [Persicimonas sp.]
MAGFHRDLKESYSIETMEGFARLSRMSGREDQWPPSESGNVDDDIYLDAVYGGVADPSQPREYVVYSIEWLEEHPDEAAEIAAAEERDEEELDRLEREQDEEIRAAETPEPSEGFEEPDEHQAIERSSGEPAEEFTRYLDETFRGWVYRKKHDEVYVLAETPDDDRRG